ncbi:MAG: PKD domain-containing protein [Bacteroidales bacterium]|nr:PKD domain-containing protein [Bacteroidales bacterium]
MKKLIPIAVIAMILLGGCVRYPHADFYTSDVVADVFDIIYFYNNSIDYDYVEWDFGDGYLTTNPDPTHHYDYPGIYTITLTAVGVNGHTDRSSITIEILSQTTLEITVLEYWDEYPVADASIILYPSLYDWEHETNPVLDSYGDVLEVFTDNRGVATIKGLNAVPYWLDVWHTHYNNYQLASEDEYFIRTLPLERNMINTFVAYVDYIESKSKKDGREVSRLKIMKLERTLKDKINSKQETVK